MTPEAIDLKNLLLQNKVYFFSDGDELNVSLSERVKDSWLSCEVLLNETSQCVMLLKLLREQTLQHPTDSVQHTTWSVQHTKESTLYNIYNSPGWRKYVWHSL